jgi:hypothetical protein
MLESAQSCFFNRAESVIAVNRLPLASVRFLIHRGSLNQSAFPRNPIDFTKIVSLT